MTTRMGLQETDVSVYNTVPRTSYGCYRRAELLETHVRIDRDRAAYCLSPSVTSLLKQYICENAKLIALPVRGRGSPAVSLHTQPPLFTEVCTRVYCYRPAFQVSASLQLNF